ncbi:amidohydrolase family protein [Lacibacter cauensis]|uniref:Amidohydrolase family protein n=1 Tax=Lacibacter cauensis TaxID=510947 RepID=A0A562SE17_9BACT|nr:amidohydrolase family protein [Lacibacter cauensis]TWI79499.1 amidohydrolase family protein [Lacibacter cauensis]
MSKCLTSGIALAIMLSACTNNVNRFSVFDVHLHGDAAPEKQLSNLAANGVSTIAVSTSWAQQQTYQSNKDLTVLQGLFVPCPNGKVPYSLQQCFEDGREWPDVNWVEQQIKEKKIDFIGEVLSQYHGISSSDSLMYPYYALAEKYNLPVGLHTGSAGPDHGCPNFKEEMGNPLLLKEVLTKFPKLRVWFMHGGGPFVKECIEMMKTYPGLYADISVLNNPNIIPAKDFATVVKEFVDAGLEDRLMFGSDNADIKKCIVAVEQLDFLSAKQKEKIFNQNAMKFFNK